MLIDTSCDMMRGLKDLTYVYFAKLIGLYDTFIYAKNPANTSPRKSIPLLMSLKHFLRMEFSEHDLTEIAALITKMSMNKLLSN